jgi:hypothetical protein
MVVCLVDTLVNWKVVEMVEMMVDLLAELMAAWMVELKAVTMEQR